MKKILKKLAFFGVPLAIVFLGFYFYLGNVTEHAQNRPVSSSAPEMVVLSASWPKYHPDVQSLYKEADLVVTGTVGRVEPSRKDEYEIVRTNMQFDIEKSYKNIYKDKNTIVIKQVGGTLDGKEWVNTDIPVFKQGEQYLLFLKRHQDLTYGVISPVSLYKIESGNAIHKESVRSSSLKDLDSELIKLQCSMEFN